MRRLRPTIGLGRGLSRRAMGDRRGAEPAPRTATTGDPPTAGDPGVDELRCQREGLVDTCVEVVDLLDSVALADRLADALERAGVVAVDPSGEAFDPGRHVAVSVAVTDDASLDDRIAHVERLGYLDGTRPVRSPEVVVWRHTDGVPAP